MRVSPGRLPSPHLRVGIVSDDRTTSSPRTSNDRSGEDARRGSPRQSPPWARTLLEFAAAVAVLALVQAFVLKAYQIPSASMEQTLLTGDRILVNRLDDSIDRGDIVVFEHGDTWETTRRSPSDSTFVNVVRVIGSIIGLGPSTSAYTVKRVLASGGETVTCCDDEGRITVDGTALEEDYLGSNFAWDPEVDSCDGAQPSLRCLPEIIVPEGSLFLLGDNRTNSADSAVGCRGQTEASQCARFVRTDQVVGPVIGRFWPPTRIGGLD